MFEKAKPARDAFAFSLRGMTTIASFTIAPAVADDRLNIARDERLSRGQEDQPDTAREIGASWGRFWLRRRLRHFPHRLISRSISSLM